MSFWIWRGCHVFFLCKSLCPHVFGSRKVWSLYRFLFFWNSGKCMEWDVSSRWTLEKDMDNSPQNLMLGAFIPAVGPATISYTINWKNLRIIVALEFQLKNAFTICITSCCYIVCVFVDTSCSYDSYSIWRGRQRACISGLGWKKSVNLGTALGWRWEGDLGWEVMRENVGAWGTKTSKCGHRELAFLFLPGEMIQLD